MNLDGSLANKIGICGKKINRAKVQVASLTALPVIETQARAFSIFYWNFVTSGPVGQLDVGEA